MKWKPHLLIDCNLLAAALWKHSYGYIIIIRKKNFYFISRNVRKKIIYLKFILLVISELCLVYRRIFFTAFAYKMNLKKAKNSEVV